MTAVGEQSILDIFTYPSVGGDDWRYTYETAVVRALEIQMLNKAALLDMANAESFEQALELLSSTEYAVPAGAGNFAEVEDMLSSRRTAVRSLFEDLMIDKSIVKLFNSRDDFANLRLVVRRVVTNRPVGTDYSSDGNVGPEQFEQVFAEENYELLPDYMRQAAEQAVLGYYQDKRIVRIDFAIDRFQAKYNLKRAKGLKSIFLTNLFRLRIDLTNIRTMLRLKFTESALRNVFLPGGFIEIERLQAGLDADYQALGALFFVTPHHRIVESAASYLSANNSFLNLEQQCQEFRSRLRLIC